MLAVAAVLTACTNEDNFINELLPNTGNEARTYTVNIPASMESEGATNRAVSFDNTSTPPTATGRFEESERVYLYNVTKEAFACNVTGEAIALYPSNISSDGKHCTLTGTGLTFYRHETKEEEHWHSEWVDESYWDEEQGQMVENGHEEWVKDIVYVDVYTPIEVEASDTYSLFYNMNNPNGDPGMCNNNYTTQNGSGASVSAYDFCSATGVRMSVSEGTLLAEDPVTFTMLQSMFRQRLTFKNASNVAVTPTITSLNISSKNNALVIRNYPLSPGVVYEPITISNPTIDTNGDIYLALLFDYSSSATDDALTLTALDSEGNVYECTKNAPSGGFKTGKYYYGAMTFTWQKQFVKPTITDIFNVRGAGSTLDPDADRMYYIYPADDSKPAEITISGTSNDYWIQSILNSIFHLSDLTAKRDDSDDFIHTFSGDLTLDISGTNTITCKNYDQAITVNGTLKLKGNGTLTVTANASSRYGLYASSNYENSNNSDASVLAANGFTVTRSDMTNNQDGTYTWTYTVMPVINGKFSVSDTKQVYFSKGNLQATTTDLGANWTWAFAAHQWDYVGSAAANTSMKTDGTGTVTANGTVDLFGWVGASSSWTTAAKWGISASTNSADYGTVDDEALKSDWGNVPGIGSGWYTLSQAEWNYLFNTRTVNGGTGNGHSYTIGKKVNSKNGVVIYPDNYTGAAYAGSDWNNFEAAGCVFLPAGGNRNGTLITSVGLGGYYWTSTSSEGSAYYVYYTMSTMNTSTSTDYRYNGCSVRLVRDAN